nr:MAG TPA: hypothetical protein [Inoviridae sp.]
MRIATPIAISISPNRISNILFTAPLLSMIFCGDYTITV